MKKPNAKIEVYFNFSIRLFWVFGARTDIWMRGGSANLSAKVLKLKLSITKYEMTTK